jgi:hypothetical protein
MFLVSRRLADQAVLAEQKAVVRGVDDDGVAELAGASERADDVTDKIVDRLERLQRRAIAQGELVPVLLLEVRRLQGFVAQVPFIEGAPGGEWDIGEGGLVFRRRDGVGALRVGGLRRDVKKERLRRPLLILDEADRPRRKHVGGIVAGARAEIEDSPVLVDLVIKISHARPSECVPEIPAAAPSRTDCRRSVL